MDAFSSMLATLETNPLTNVPLILAVMGLLAFVEAFAPLSKRGAWTKAHRIPNLVLTGITFASYLLFNAAMVLVLPRLGASRAGLLHYVALPSEISALVAVLVLDLSFYVAHRSMHTVGLFWRFHSVHHSDPAVDVTTTLRQHPGESLIRFAFIAAFAVPLGASAGQLALYRVLQALSGLAEHANFRVPLAVDRALALVFSWPNMHKVHHSRDVRFTDTNFGNIVSWWDRLFGTFTPSRCGVSVEYGLDGLDDPRSQTITGLLLMPWQLDGRTRAPRPSRLACETDAAPASNSVPRPYKKSVDCEANSDEVPHRGWASGA